MNILITSASRKVGLVRAFQRALSQKGGGAVIAVDTSPFAVGLYLADDHFLVPRTNHPDFLVVMLRLCERREVALLVPTRDEELAIFSANKEKFAEIGTTVMVPELRTVAVCQDKKEFITFCKAHGISVPRTYDRLERLADAAYPLFVKPRRGKGGGGARRVDSAEDLRLAIKQSPELIIQELIEAPEYTVDYFADFAGRTVSVVPRERVSVFGGESFISRTCHNPLLIRESVRLAGKLGLVGHNTIQAFLCDGGVKFIEVNPRFGGGANLSFAAGASTPHFLVSLLKGERVERKYDEFADNRIMMRYTEDMFLDADALTQKRFV